jgi:hypothetical protein
VKPSQRRWLRAALILTISAVLLIAAAGPILSSIFNQRIKARLEASNIRFGSLSINLFARSISLKDVEWSQNSREAKVAHVKAKGIGIFPYLKNKQISVRELSFTGGTLSIPRDTVEHELKPDSIKFSSIDVDRIILDDLDVAIKNDTLTEYRAKVRLVVHFFFLRNPNLYRDPSAYTFRNIETQVRDLRIHQANSLYEFEIKELRFDKELRKLHLDSIVLQPILDKDAFAKKVKSQETHTVLKVAGVDASGVNMAVHMEDTSIMVSSLTINGAYVHAYKNKKYPFTRKEKFPLPMESFQALQFGIEVDTIKIHDTKITYEELPTEGFHTSHITFDDVEATMSSVNNREFKNLSGVSVLEASAKVMKTGNVKATFKLPLEAKKKYTAEGSIENVPLTELNPLLVDLAFVEIASGQLNKLDFGFTYDDTGSQGELHFDYEDLKIRGLKKEPHHELAAFKTILINTAVKNDETLTGKIDVERNQRKAVFNLWTISLVDGIKEALLPKPVKKIQANKENKNKKAGKKKGK